MNTRQLDPDTENDLGKGVFTQDQEEKLIEQGYVFAHRHHVVGQKRPVTFCSKRPVAFAATELVVDAWRVSRPRVIATVPTP